MRLHSVLMVALAGLAMAGPACAGLFSDDEARQRIDEQTKQLKLLSERVGKVDGRLTGVENTINDGGSMLNLLNQIETLNAEIARLRGELEAANNRVEIAEKRSKELYLDVDSRLRNLESPAAAEATAATAAPAPAAAAPAPAPAAPAKPVMPAETAPVPAVSTGAAPVPATAPSPAGAPRTPGAVVVTARPGVSGDPVAEASAYEAAHATRRAGRFADAAKMFAQFVAAHPASSLAAPAQYWVGDSLYNAKDYAGAIAAHRFLLDTYPSSNKVPDSMLNMASCLREMGDLSGERKTLDQLVNRYPSSEAAEKARKRLSASR